MAEGASAGPAIALRHVQLCYPGVFALIRSSASAPPPDPKLYTTYDGSMGDPKDPALGTEAGPMGKLKSKLTP
jgi:Mn-containing catalase